MHSGKKILIATGIYPPDGGGPATYSKLLYDQLPKESFEVEVLSFGEVRHLPKLLRHIVYFIKTIRRGRTMDIIFAQDPVSVGLPAMLAARLLRKKFLLKIVGDYAWEQGIQRFGVTDRLDDFAGKTHGYGVGVRMLKIIERVVAQNAERIIVPSEYLRTIVVKWGVSAKQVQVIYNAFQAPIISKTREEIRRERGLLSPLVVSAGRLVPWKGFQRVIETVGDIPDIHLVIVGEGPLRGELESLVKKLNLSDRVTFTGNVLHTTALEYLKAADVFVLNTAYEGFSHFLLEVMAIGTPVITTPVGGNRELIEDGVSGIFVQQNDRSALGVAINRLMKDPGLRKQLAVHAQQSVTKFSKERMFADLVSLIKSI